MASPAPLKSVPAAPIEVDHIHSGSELCPVCDQPIPNEKLDEIRQRLEAREDEQARAITTKLQAEFARTKALDDAKAQAAIDEANRKAQAALEEERRAATEKVAAAHEQGRHQAAAEATEEVTKAREAFEELKVRTDSQLEQATQEKAAAEERRDALTRELAQARADGAAALDREKLQAANREVDIRSEAERQATASAQEQIATVQRAHQDAEAALNERLATAETAKAAVEQAAIDTKNEFEGQIRTLNLSIDERLQEQREALEKAKDAAVNAEKAAAFEANQKLSDKVTELQRALEKKTAEELGEGAEIDLFEALKAAFPDDKIDRIGKGDPGADIRHTIVLNGQACGKIIYDSKNHKGWRSEFVTKLAADQIADKADHAVLSVLKFPAGARQLDVRESVIVSNPGRVVAVVHILRRHLLDAHVRRVSNEERAHKTAELYQFITSDRCADMFARIDSHADKLLAMQVKEKKAHDKMWKDQGVLLTAIQKVNAEIGHEIGMIIGTATRE